MSRISKTNFGWAIAIGLGCIFAGIGISALAKTTASGRRTPASFKPIVKKGHLLCPSEEGRTPASIKGANVNDYVVVKLLAADRSFVESAWGRIIGFNEDRSVVRLELTTSLSEAGLTGLATDRHGFGIGERINVMANCVYDVLKQPDSKKFVILCGLPLKQAGYEIPQAVLSLSPGDTVRLVIGSPSTVGDVLPGSIWKEEILASVVSLGKTGDVIRGLVRSDPSNPNHDLRRHHEVFFTRDCIVELWKYS